MRVLTPRWTPGEPSARSRVLHRLHQRSAPPGALGLGQQVDVQVGRVGGEDGVVGGVAVVDHGDEQLVEVVAAGADG